MNRLKNPSLLLIPGIAACAAVMIGSLCFLYHPVTAEEIHQFAAAAESRLLEQVSSLPEAVSSLLERFDASASTDALPVAAAKEEDPPYIQSSGEQGSISRLGPEGAEDSDQTYLYMLDTGCGPMVYFNQTDSRWSDFLYGGNDPMEKYGCGPSAVAMVINSFSDYAVNPTDLAVWAWDNGYYALHGGSYHSLIPDALEAYGLHAESVTDRSFEHVSELLSSGHILVALMGRGSLTENGHFVLFTKLLDNGSITIADPADYENCTMEWDLEQLLSELKKSYDSGGPLWAVQP